MDHEVELTEKIIGCAIEVHRALGPGLLESAYKKALCLELAHHGMGSNATTSSRSNIAVKCWASIRST